MVAFNNLPGQVQSLAGQIKNPALSPGNDGDMAALSLSREGAQHIQAIHGQWYTASRRGNLFIASTAAAGVTVPVEDATALASTAGMVNPSTSGVIMELVAIGMVNTTIDVALKPFVLCFQKNLSTSGGAPTSVTALTSHASPIGLGSAVAKCVAHSAATFTNAAEMAPRLNMFGTYQTAVGEGMKGWYTFDGMVTMGPDNAFAIVNAVTAVAGHQITYVWAEWPI